MLPTNQKGEETMKHVWRCIVILTIVCLSATASLAASNADDLYRKAIRLETAFQLTEAADLYQEAMRIYFDNNEKEKAMRCRVGYGRVQKIRYEYPYTKAQAKEAIKKIAPQAAEKRIDAWLKEPNVERLTIDGEPRYFLSVDKNFTFRNYDVGRSFKQIQEGYTLYYTIIKRLIDDNTREILPRGAVYPYKKPVVYRGTWTLTIKRQELPQGGTVQLWIPLPILTGSQTDVKDITISPQEYVKLPPRIDTELGLAYMEVPLDKLKKDLVITTGFTFKHYTQRFKINPDDVGSYDVNSALYRKYTASRANTITEWGITERAREVIGNEANPYRAARKIYDYVVSQVYYSFMPHYSLDARRYPESVYVHKNRYGDCGAQSSYFSALCRAVGIPARTTGGFQIIKKGTASGHFWAEFYLPNYGWIPVDTSVAQAVDYLPTLTEKEKKEYKDYFFGNMDPYRLVIQKDIDIPLTPPASEPIMLAMGIQDAAILCDTTMSHPGFLLIEGWKYEIKEVSGRDN